MATKQGLWGHMTGVRLSGIEFLNSNEQDQLHKINWQFLQILILLMGNSFPNPYIHQTAWSPYLGKLIPFISPVSFVMHIHLLSFMVWMGLRVGG